MEIIAVCTIAFMTLTLLCVTLVYFNNWRTSHNERVRQDEQASQIAQLKTDIANLQSEIELLRQSQSKHFPYQSLEEIENFLAAALKAEMVAADLEHDAEAFRLRAQTARSTMDRAYKIAHALRGSNGHKK